MAIPSTRRRPTNRLLLAFTFFGVIVSATRARADVDEVAAEPPKRRSRKRSLVLIALVGLIAAACASTVASSSVAEAGSVTERAAQALHAAAESEATPDDSAAVTSAEPQAASSSEDVAEDGPESSTSPQSEAPESSSGSLVDNDSAGSVQEPDEGSASADSPSEPGLDFSDTGLPPAQVGFDDLALDHDGRRPVSLAIEAIDVVDAAVIAVGVNPDQTFEVPPADEVGWYRFGPTPGDEGSAVLAAHIAFDGVDGVFRHLADAEVGSVVVVGFDDGTSQRYRIESITDYVKEELPDELFARTGDAQLALITCGGSFNPELRSYDSNTVAVAVPI
ncbi:MAG: sortase [Actinomycetota bacterium]